MDLSRPHLSPLWDYQHNNYQRADVRYRRITAAADAAGKAAQTAASASATTTAVASISSSTSARTAAVTTSTGRSGVPAGLATTTTTTTTASAASTVAPGIESRIAPIRSSFDVHVSGAFGHDGAYMNLADRAGNGLGDGGSRSNINSNSTGSTSASSSSSSSPCGPDNDNDNDGDGGDDDDDRDDDEDGRGASGDQDDKSSSRSQAGRRDGAADTAKTAKATPTGAGPTAAAAVGGGGGGASSGAATKTTKARRLKKAMPLLVNLTNCKYDIVRECVVNHGCKVVDDPTAWSLFWIDTGVSLERVLEMKAHQRINHFPGMHEICRKDHLARNLGRLSRLFPKDYNFFPKTWMLPSEWSEFKMSFKPSRKGGGGGSGSGSSSGQSFIAKPDHGCQGKGIFLFKDPDQVHDLRNSNMIIQTYLASPCLIDGFKFDLRVYVLVTSVDPLRVFIYRDGLARFATEKYHPPSDKNMGNVCMHLTNYAINKHSDKFVRDDDERGSKRTISSVLKQLVELGRIPSAEDTWRRISDVVVKTIVTVQPQISRGLKSWFPSATALQGLAHRNRSRSLLVTNSSSSSRLHR
ncbi:tubulin-tyrosine ligase family-domain-containing protein [Entophlyctis helioformis]|nr:tubulin-tyrosine ligase family-domain-containing protein [Entophlyctis helioformis]